MRFRRMGYGRIGRTNRSPAWIDRWARTRYGWQLKVLWRRNDAWVSELLPAQRMLKTRLFEPATPNVQILGTESRRFKIPNLAALSPLVEPRELLGPMLPHAALSAGHTIYVAETEGKPLYLPALLLIERLWLWSSDALRAILIPNSLDALLGTPRKTDEGIEVTVDPGLASRAPSDAALRRIAWLTQSRQARRSWSSVLTNAYENRIDLLLPPARMSGWAWSVELASGYLACELLSPQLEFELNDPRPRFRIGSVLHECPDDSSAVRASGQRDNSRQALCQHQAAQPCHLPEEYLT